MKISDTLRDRQACWGWRAATDPKLAAPGSPGARDPDWQQVKGPPYRSWVLPSWNMSIDR